MHTDTLDFRLPQTREMKLKIKGLTVTTAECISTCDTCRVYSRRTQYATERTSILATLVDRSTKIFTVTVNETKDGSSSHLILS